MPHSPQSRRRVVITGIGVVSPNGVGREAFAAACRAGRSGLSRPDHIDTAGLRTTSVARVIDWSPETVMPTAELRRVPRMVPLALAASREALAQANLNFAADDVERQRMIGVALGLRGPSHVLSTGCTSSTDAIGYAAMLVRDGAVPSMLAGGADAPISRGILTAFEKMRVISTRRWDDATHSSCPFSADRDGFVLGEGAWMFVLEEREHASARGAVPLAEIAGYASTCDAYHRVQIDPEVVEPVRAMELALAEAGRAKDEVGYVNLHGTSTDLNDRMETAALRKCFGAQAGRVPMSSTKSMIGHPQGACGAAGLAATVLAMRDGVLHPTINLERPDPRCDLDYVPNVARAAAIDVALCNCIAFGSKNSAIVVTKGTDQ